ncbi:MAG: hypothetical protein HeimC3_31360 [Candidatus Heimdallarchaeota archaeon LC_3]|nr:MAG: hypothetical protein HeimC3_31360 [Candidatus Heimdallarchaeota archaeon LC_3]
MLSQVIPLLASPTDRSTTTVHWLADNSEVIGSSATLVRTNSGISYTLHTSGLNPGDAVTNWWIIFNNPEACQDGCGLDDLFRPGVDASARFASGHVVGADSSANFAGSLKVGETDGALNVHLFGPGLINSREAEIHFIVRTHGPAVPGFIDDMLHTVDGGCQFGACEDLQAAAFLP